MNDGAPDVFDEYQPRGLCATACGHKATELWIIYGGKSRYDYRCACCCVAGRLERAHKIAATIPELEAEFAKVKSKCQNAE